MDRPKHRRLILLCLALLAGGALLLFGRQWSSTDAPPPAPAQQSTPQLIEQPANRAESAPAEAPKPASTTAKTVAAAETGTFRGRVIDAASRQPVQEFEVRLAEVVHERFLGKQRAAQAFHSADGRFVWQQAPVGNWGVTVVAPRYQHFRLEGLNIAVGKTTREVVMPLLRGHIVKGRVFDQISGAGIGDVHVSLRDPTWVPNQAGDLRVRATTKDDGTFVLDGVPAGETIVRVVAKDHAMRDVSVIAKEDTPPLEIGLVTGGKVAGMVVAPDGTPASGHVMLSGPGVGDGGALDETGSFSFTNRAAGRYLLTAMTAAGNASLDIELAENEFREGLVLKIGEGRTVRGVVKGLRPEQLERTYISVFSEARRAGFTAIADQQGAYAVKGIPPGRARVTAGADMSRHFDKTIDVPTDQDVVLDIVFPPGLRVSGRVTQGTKPVANRSVWAASTDGKRDMSYRGRTDADGRYEVEGVPPGEYRFAVEEGTSRVVTIASDAVVNFDMPLVQVGGRVFEEGGTVPIVGAGVHIIGTEPQTAIVRVYKETDDFGEFQLVGIEPGEILLTVFKPGYEMQREKISYSSPITKKTITLRKSTGVEVRVQFPPDRVQTRQVFVREQLPGSDYGITLAIPLDRDGVGYLPSALAGSTLQFPRRDATPIVIERWDGRALDLRF